MNIKTSEAIVKSLYLIDLISDKYKYINEKTVIPIIEPLLVSKIEISGVEYSRYLSSLVLK